jgi:hypothetical protein
MSEFIEAVRVLGFWRTVYARFAYRHVMKLAHRFNWHYAPPLPLIAPDYTTQLWCQWCGMRYTKPHKRVPGMPLPSPPTEGR